MREQSSSEKRRDDRKYLQGSGTLLPDSDMHEVVTVNVSENGAKFELQQPVTFVVRVQVGAYEMEQEANLVWARRNANGKMEYGMEYLSPSEEIYPEPSGPLRLVW